MPEATVSIRVLVVDDHQVVVDGLTLLLGSVEGIMVAGAVSSGEQAIAQLTQLEVDVVLMDIEMPGMGGIEATRHIAAAHPGVAVVMLTMYADGESVFAALRAGARGYLLKGAGQADVVRVLRGIARGDVVFGAEIAGPVLGVFAEPGPSVLPFPVLSPREREILGLLASGWANGRIARHLSLSTKTVANYVSAILTKLQLPDRSSAIVAARRAGLGDGN